MRVINENKHKHKGKMTKEELQKQVVRKTNVLFLLADMIELTASDLQDMHVNLNTYKFNIKNKINQIKLHSGDLVRIVSDVYKDEMNAQIQFGETSDILLERIINEIYGE